MTATAQTQNAPIDFNTIPLNKPLDPKFVEGLTLDDLRALRTSLIKRAVAVITEQRQILAQSDWDKKNYMHFDVIRVDKKTDKLLFYYNSDFRKEPEYVFVPGEWFDAELKELDRLRAEKEEAEVTFHARERTRLASEFLTGAKNPYSDCRLGANRYV